MGDRTCSTDGCTGRHYAREWCKKHYDEWRKSPEADGIKRHWARPKRTHCARGHEFTPENTYARPSGRRQCRQCKEAWNRSGKKLEGQLRNKYGITVEQWEHMFRTQNGKCAICGIKSPKFDVDHCHETGKVRGLLCHRCNMGIGLLGDQPETVARAVAYLQEFGRTRS